MNRRQFLAGSIGLAAVPAIAKAAPTLPFYETKRLRTEVQKQIRLYREPFFHTPFDHVTDGGMAIGELCYLVGQDMTNWWKECRVLNTDPKIFNRVVHDLPNHLLKMNTEKSWADYNKIMLVTTGGHKRWVTSINQGATFLFFKSVPAIRQYAYENGLFALVDGTFAEQESFADWRSADFVIEAQPPSMHLLKNRYGPKETVHFG